MRTLAGPGLRKGGMRGLARIAQMTCISLRMLVPSGLGLGRLGRAMNRAQARTLTATNGRSPALNQEGQYGHRSW